VHVVLYALMTVLIQGHPLGCIPGAQVRYCALGVVLADVLGGVGCYSWVAVHGIIMSTLAKRALSGSDVIDIVPSALLPLLGGYAHPIDHLWCSTPKVRHCTFLGLGDDLLPSRIGLLELMVTQRKKDCPK
jgi:hypothetical protein